MFFAFSDFIKLFWVGFLRCYLGTLFFTFLLYDIQRVDSANKNFAILSTSEAL